MADVDARPHSPLRRAFGAIVIAVVCFVLLWWAVFTATTAALIAVGIGVAAWAMAGVSEFIEGVVSAIGAVLAAIAAVFTIFS
ncbi:MAG: hypothetical protein JNK46_06350 [Methylobacteriaceae bacterium]|nr:hypothetical protein [Methylobacteriaceae bacterium]